MIQRARYAMNLRQLGVVQTVVEFGSVTAAATRLGLTQSAVSRIIAAVEAELGLALFERYRRRLIPSEHALRFVARAEQISTSMQELVASARSVREGRTDRLRVISVPPFLQNILPLTIARRSRSNPQLSVRLDAVRRVDIPDWINKRDFDIAIVGLPVDRPEVRVQALPPVHAVAVFPREHRLARQTRVRLKDILDGPLVSHSTGPLLRFELDRVLAGQGLAPAPVIEASSGWLVCNMVANGIGAAVMDPFTAVARAGSGLIVRPLKEKILLRYGILTLRERPLVGEAAALVQEIEHEIRKSIRPER
jgi:DNA-binding transcriptional LysR family regulator